jgi:glycosyltransferase involved in cell wall biosynthesis
MMVSVVIPTYNRSSFLRDALSSVFAQKGVPMEVIVVDDGSTDDTAHIVESFDGAVRYFYQRRAGVSAARNRGIENSRGKWLAFLDSDDIWLQGKLLSQIGYLSKHPQMRICQTEEIWVRNGRRVNPKACHKKPAGYCFGHLLERCLISPSAVIVHRDLFDRVGIFDELLPACEDYDLWLRIGCRYPIGLVEKPLILKQGGHPDQLSSSVPALDRYRIQSLVKLICSESLTVEQENQALHALWRKSRIYCNGCRKRGRLAELEGIVSLLRRVTEKTGLCSPEFKDPKTDGAKRACGALSNTPCS